MVEATGRTRDEAVARAVAELGIPRNDAEVIVVEERRQRFLGLFGGPVVRVRVRRRGHGGAGSAQGAPNASDAERTREIVEGLLSAMDVRASVSVEAATDGAPRVQIVTQGSDGLLIGRHGQTLLALEHLANRILTKARDDRPVVTIDVGGYRARGGKPSEDADERPIRRETADARRPRRRARARAS
jgi:spoIIIJ-associated protein